MPRYIICMYGSWSTRPIPNSPKNQLAQFWSTRPKTNSPNYELAQIWSTRPFFSKCHLSTRPKPLVNSPNVFTNSPKFKSHLFRVFCKKKVDCYKISKIDTAFLKTLTFAFKFSFIINCHDNLSQRLH